MEDLFVAQRQLWSYESTRLPVCAISCMLDEACVSFYFNNLTNGCSGHSIVLANLTQAEEQTGNAYYILDCRGE